MTSRRIEIDRTGQDETRRAREERERATRRIQEELKAGGRKEGRDGRKEEKGERGRRKKGEKRENGCVCMYLCTYNQTSKLQTAKHPRNTHAQAQAQVHASTSYTIPFIQPRLNELRERRYLTIPRIRIPLFKSSQDLRERVIEFCRGCLPADDGVAEPQ